MDPVQPGATVRVRPQWAREYVGVVQAMESPAFAVIWDGARDRLEPTASILEVLPRKEPHG